MAEEPKVAGKDVKDYMGEQAVNPLMLLLQLLMLLFF